MRELVGGGRTTDVFARHVCGCGRGERRRPPPLALKRAVGVAAARKGLTCMNKLVCHSRLAASFLSPFKFLASLPAAAIYHPRTPRQSPQFFACLSAEPRSLNEISVNQQRKAAVVFEGMG